MPKKAEKFEPERHEDGWVDRGEDESAYARRIKEAHLPNFPEDVLIQWFHRSYPHFQDYAFLDFQTLQFDEKPQLWKTEEIPGREVFEDETLCDNRAWHFSSGKYRTWVMSYMLEHGTWPRPIILLHVPEKCVAPWGAPLKRPYHLLEGQTRLAVFTVLRERGELLDQHPIWVVKKENWLGSGVSEAEREYSDE